jgi:hypothetical protein
VSFIDKILAFGSPPLAIMSSKSIHIMAAGRAVIFSGVTMKTISWNSALGRVFLLAGVLLVLAVVVAGRAGLEGAAHREKMRGVCFVGGAPVDDSHFLALMNIGVDWISQTPFGWQQNPDDPNITLATDGHVYWGERDVGLRETTRLAHGNDARTMLKPHIWLMDRDHSFWSGAIAMTSEDDWAAWFASYQVFILHYARLAQEEGDDALCIGTELEGTTHREQEWRQIIAAVREVYDGSLTYAANWSGEFERIGFWDALDFIGVQAYFPLSQDPDPGIDELVDAWIPFRDRLATLSEQTGKRIVFTEVGYRSAPGAAIEPWLWRSTGPSDHITQANCYQAAFQALWNEPWFMGTFWWKWFPHWQDDHSAEDRSFTPQGKDAIAVISRWYNGGVTFGTPAD